MGQQAAKLRCSQSDGPLAEVPAADTSGGSGCESPACSSTAPATPGTDCWQADSDYSGGGAGVSDSASTCTSRCRPSPDSPGCGGSRQLFVLVHGICGHERDWEVWKQRLDSRERPDWEIRISTSITPGAYFAGFEIQRLGDLLASEVTDWVKELLLACSKVVLHFICHSLGGLIMRACLPQVCDALAGDRRLIYGQLLTLNTPHLGVRGANLLMCWKNMSFLIPKRFSSQIHQLTLEDNAGSSVAGDEGCLEDVATADSASFSPSTCISRSTRTARRHRRLLEELADPDGRFCRALAKFQHRTAVAASHWDVIVPFCTAAICTTNPFRSPNLLTGDFHSFWRVDAAVGFQANSPLAQCQQHGGEAAEALARSLAEGAVGPRPGGCAEHLAHAEARSVGSPPSRQRCYSSDSRDDPWMRSSDSEVEFPAQMLNLFALGPPWRRVAYTLHQPWLNGDVHLFTIGKDKKVLPWAIEFIDLLISMFQDVHDGAKNQFPDYVDPHDSGQ